jgi:hypothetical protein
MQVCELLNTYSATACNAVGMYQKDTTTVHCYASSSAVHTCRSESHSQDGAKEHSVEDNQPCEVLQGVTSE